MRTRGVVRIDAGTEEEAKVLAAALGADDAAVAPCRAEGRFVVVAIDARTTGGALRTLDDALEGLRAARSPGPATKGSR